MFEKLLAVLTALIAAIEANTAAQTGKKAKAEKPAAEEKKEEKTATVHPSAQDVRDAAKKLLDATNNQDGGLFPKLAAKHGVKKVSEVPEDKRAEVIAEILKAIPAAPSPTEAI